MPADAGLGGLGTERDALVPAFLLKEESRSSAEGKRRGLSPEGGPASTTRSDSRMCRTSGTKAPEAQCRQDTRQASNAPSDASQLWDTFSFSEHHTCEGKPVSNPNYLNPIKFHHRLLPGLPGGQ